MKKVSFTKIILGFLLVVVIGALVATSIFFFIKYQKLLSNDPKHELANIIREVSQFMELPNEEPQLATVTDQEKLREQGLFKKAENGDKVLIYVNEGRAILYRPSQKKVIDVVPVQANTQTQTTAGTQNNTTQPTPTATPVQSEDKPMSVALYNGSSTKGISTKAQELVLKKFPKADIIVPVNASRDTFTETLIVNVSGGHSTQATALATELDGKVVELPSGEEKPQADVLIVLGSDFAETFAAAASTPTPTFDPNPITNP